MLFNNWIQKRQHAVTNQLSADNQQVLLFTAVQNVWLPDPFVRFKDAHFLDIWCIL